MFQASPTSSLKRSSEERTGEGFTSAVAVGESSGLRTSGAQTGSMGGRAAGLEKPTKNPPRYHVGYAQKPLLFLLVLLLCLSSLQTSPFLHLMTVEVVAIPAVTATTSDRYCRRGCTAT